jgi:hypothetical protein
MLGICRRGGCADGLSAIAACKKTRFFDKLPVVELPCIRGNNVSR